MWHFEQYIEIHGNTRTRDYVIRREFDIAEGDAYNKTIGSMERQVLPQARRFAGLQGIEREIETRVIETDIRDITAVELTAPELSAAELSATELSAAELTAAELTEELFATELPLAELLSPPDSGTTP